MLALQECQEHFVLPICEPSLVHRDTPPWLDYWTGYDDGQC